MTKITFYKRDGIYYGFRETGHADYAEAGEDILCAALSAMTMLIVNAIEVSWASPVDYRLDEQTTDIQVIARGALPESGEDERTQYAIAGLLQGYFFQLTDMLEDYYDHIQVEETEEDPSL